MSSSSKRGIDIYPTGLALQELQDFSRKYRDMVGSEIPHPNAPTSMYIRALWGLQDSRPRYGY